MSQFRRVDARRGLVATIVAALAGVLAADAAAQHVAGGGPHRPTDHMAPHFVVPQSRSFSAHHEQHRIISVEGVRAHVDIVELSATTTLDITMRNNSDRQEEAVLLIPLPDGSAISSFMFEGTASEPTVEILTRAEARRIYDSIVARVRDPALLEFAGHDLLRSSVFPVAPKATQRIRLTYEHLLEANGDALSFVLPRSQSLENRVPWTIMVDVRSGQPISAVYSPTHEVLTERMSPSHMTVTVAPQSADAPGPFRLFTLREKGDVSATLMAYPDPTIGGGYFLLAAGLPASAAEGGTARRRDITIVLDRSGSMVGEKMDQGRRALQHVLESLDNGETFNIVDFGTSVNRFAPQPVAKSAESMARAMAYVQNLAANGGTNTFAALHEALRQAPPEGSLPMVLFLTDGVPTIGRSTEHDIRALVEKGNAHNKRVYTFGVGHDVNAPLLDRLADVTRGVASYVQPNEDVSMAVAVTVRTLRGPVLTDLTLTVLNAGGAPSSTLLADLQPAIIPDLFEGDQLVLLGRYTSEEQVNVRLQGNYLGRHRAFNIRFDLASASTRNDFVPRLWATRRIAELIDKVRQHGPTSAHGALPSDPHVDAIVQEIVALSTKFGILTEYTAFLAREGTNLGDAPELLTTCRSNLESRAVGTRWGTAAVNQSINYNQQKMQTALKPRNDYIDETMQHVEFSAVQQVADCALFNKGGTWIDSRLATRSEAAQVPSRTVTLGSDEHRALLDELIAQGRQALIAMPGDVLLLINGERVLVINMPHTN
jgi:Ca-activated chloride channel family protein